MIARSLPTHLDLPETDGLPVENTFQLPQAEILNQSIRPILNKIHPDGRFLAASDTGIYFKITDPPLEGCRAPDWFYVPNVDRMEDGEYRRSYVLWIERVPPRIVMKFVSGDGSAERDATPETGKFWIYERLMQAEYYVIYEPDREVVEVYRLLRGRYRRVRANARGHLPIAFLGLELGLQRSDFGEHDNFLWLRWFDSKGRILPHADERAESLSQRAKKEKDRADRLAANLRELGVNPDDIR